MSECEPNIPSRCANKLNTLAEYRHKSNKTVHLFPGLFSLFCIFSHWLFSSFHFLPIRLTHIPIAVASHWNGRSDSHFMLSQSREHWEFREWVVQEKWRNFLQQRSSISWDERFQYLLHLGTACYETKTTRQTRHKSLKIKKKYIWLKQNTNEQQNEEIVLNKKVEDYDVGGGGERKRKNQHIVFRIKS